MIASVMNIKKIYAPNSESVDESSLVVIIRLSIHATYVYIQDVATNKHYQHLHVESSMHAQCYF